MTDILHQLTEHQKSLKEYVFGNAKTKLIGKDIAYLV